VVLTGGYPTKVAVVFLRVLANGHVDRSSPGLARLQGGPASPGLTMTPAKAPCVSFAGNIATFGEFGRERGHAGESLQLVKFGDAGSPTGNFAADSFAFAEGVTQEPVVVERAATLGADVERVRWIAVNEDVEQEFA
jgi:hypothetical protein